MAGIQINEAASIMTEVTTIFQDNRDERYVNLQADQKEISKTINNFVNERRALMAMTQEDIDANFDANFEISAQQLDSDQARAYLAMNTAAWVQGAHTSLDPYNQYDKAMLCKMADYVYRIRIIVESAPFFATPDNETNRKAVFLTRDDIVPTRSDEEIEKRKRVEDSDESFMPAKTRTLDQNRQMYTSENSSTENVSER